MYGKPLNAVANIKFTVPEPSSNVTSDVLGAANRAQPASRLVSRIQLLTGGQAPWSLLLVSLLAGASLLIFLTRHGLRLKKLLVEGEHYALHHPAFDMLIVVLITAGYVLTRSSGFIR